MSSQFCPSAYVPRSMRSAALLSARISTSIRCLARCVVGCVLFSCSATALGEPDWRAFAETALQRALTERYSDVESWHVRALTGDRQEQRLAALPATTAQVLQLGARSAVRILCDPKPQRQCATVWYEVRGMQHAWTAGAEAVEGSELTSANLNLQLHDVVKLGCEPLT